MIGRDGPADAAPAMPGPGRRPPAGTILCLGVNVAGLLALAAMVVVRGKGFWKDEAWYLASVPDLRREGLSAAFLRGLPGPAGPLYACVQLLLSPLTGLTPTGTRLANVGLFLLTALALGAVLRLRRVEFAEIKGTFLLSAPMMFGVVGTAITELPAMLAYCVALALLLGSLEHAGRGRRVGPAMLAAAAGVSAGLAVVGRQQYLMALVAAPALGWRRPASWGALLVFAACAAALPAAVFACWGGMVPPRTQYVGEGFSPAHLALSFAYAGIVYSIYDLTWIRGRWRIFLGVIASGLALNLATGVASHLVMQDTALRLLPAWALPWYARGVSGLMLGFGLAFLMRLVRATVDADPARKYCGVAALLMLATPAKITHLFAGRYVLAALPLLVVLGCEEAPDTRGKAARMAAGCSLGLVSLDSYLTYA